MLFSLQSLDASKDETKSEKADDSVSEVETESEQGTPGGTNICFIVLQENIWHYILKTRWLCILLSLI